MIILKLKLKWKIRLEEQHTKLHQDGHETKNQLRHMHI